MEVNALPNMKRKIIQPTAAPDLRPSKMKRLITIAILQCFHSWKIKEKIKNTYFFYTTCPKCAKTYGKNYVVGLAQYRMKYSYPCRK